MGVVSFKNIEKLSMNPRRVLFIFHGVGHHGNLKELVQFLKFLKEKHLKIKKDQLFVSYL